MRWTNGDFHLQIKKIKSLEGSQLQAVRTLAQGLELTFWSSESAKTVWFFDLNQKQPGFYLAPKGQSVPRKAKKTPLELFLNSNFKNKRLIKVEDLQKYGRVLWLQFTEGYQLELRLFPHGVNVTAHADKKCLHFLKPKDLVELDSFRNDPASFIDSKTDEQIWGELFEAKLKATLNKSNHEDKILKLEKVKQKIEGDLQKDKSKVWFDLAQSLHLGEFKGVLPDPRQSRQWNINYCFEQQKSEKAKQGRRQQRLLDIQNEILKLKSATKSGQKIHQTQAPTTRSDLFSKSKTKGQASVLPSGHKMYFGKNAKDNLQLIRVASAWDLWFHIKDQPGSHGILVRNKKELISHSILTQAASELLKFSFRTNPAKYYGQKFEVLYTQLRFVKPIKGDKLGRVTHTKASNLLVLFEAN